MTYANQAQLSGARQDILAALADPTRAAVYEDVASAPKSVTDIAARLPVSRPAVSQHLKVLSDAGLVTAKRKGRQQIYHADPAGLAPLRAWLDAMWSDVLGAFADHVATEGAPE